MKTRISLCVLSALTLFAGFPLLAQLAPLPATTAVHTKPEVSSPAINFLKAGTVPVAAASAPANLPAGWVAIELAGPFEAYVENKDLTKSLDLKPGVSVRTAPKADAPVLTVAEKDDKAVISGLKGKWTQISLEKKLLGFIQTSAATPATFAAAPAAYSAPAPMPLAPVAPSAYGTNAPGQAATMVNLGDGGGSALPRQFAGRFVSTRRALAPRRPYEYALNDDAGKRYAYADISKLLLTEQIEKYIDRQVVVFGAAKPVPDTKDIVIVVETLQLK